MLCLPRPFTTVEGTLPHPGGFFRFRRPITSRSYGRVTLHPSGFSSGSRRKYWTPLSGSLRSTSSSRLGKTSLRTHIATPLESKCGSALSFNTAITTLYGRAHKSESRHPHRSRHMQYILAHLFRDLTYENDRHELFCNSKAALQNEHKKEPLRIIRT